MCTYPKIVQEIIDTQQHIVSLRYSCHNFKFWGSQHFVQWNVFEVHIFCLYHMFCGWCSTFTKDLSLLLNYCTHTWITYLLSQWSTQGEEGWFGRGSIGKQSLSTGRCRRCCLEVYRHSWHMQSSILYQSICLFHSPVERMLQRRTSHSQLDKITDLYNIWTWLREQAPLPCIY